MWSICGQCVDNRVMLQWLMGVKVCYDSDYLYLTLTFFSLAAFVDDCIEAEWKQCIGLLMDIFEDLANMESIEDNCE